MYMHSVGKVLWLPVAFALVTLTSAMATSFDNVPVAGAPAPETDHSAQVVGKFTLHAGDPSLTEWLLPPPPRVGADDNRARELVSLGRTLFFDERLSASRTRSCASCHRPELGWSDGLPTAMGTQGQMLSRATPSLFNVAYGTTFTWDGRAASLEEQAMGPVYNPDEMGIDPDELFKRLRGDAFYRRMFGILFPGEPINETGVGKAIAAFEKTLVTRNSRFDQWVAGDIGALTVSEIRGFAVFLDPDRANCGGCHAPPNFTDDGFHNIGLNTQAMENPDLGRYEIRPVALMRGAFKTPSLRNIALTPPYFHDGTADDLEGVVDHYIDVGNNGESLSPEMREIALDAGEKKDLIAFLHALTELPNYSVQDASLEFTSD